MSHPGKLFRYSASAGSGKTHALTGFYLSRILHDPSAYRRILAVTFTNSAASEMKGRILSRLDKLSGEPADEKEKKESVINNRSYHNEIIDYIKNIGNLLGYNTDLKGNIKNSGKISINSFMRGTSSNFENIYG